MRSHNTFCVTTEALCNATARVREHLVKEMNRRGDLERFLEPIGEPPFVKVRITTRSPMAVLPPKGYVVEVSKTSPVSMLCIPLAQELQVREARLFCQAQELAYDRGLIGQSCVTLPGRMAKSQGKDWIDMEVQSADFHVTILQRRLRHAVEELLLRPDVVRWDDLIARHFYDEISVRVITLFNLVGDEILVAEQVDSSEAIPSLKARIAGALGITCVDLVFEDVVLEDSQTVGSSGLVDGSNVTAIDRDGEILKPARALIISPLSISGLVQRDFNRRHDQV